jgi:hypothetical protein
LIVVLIVDAGFITVDAGFIGACHITVRLYGGHWRCLPGKLHQRRP